MTRPAHRSNRSWVTVLLVLTLVIGVVWFVNRGEDFPEDEVPNSFPPSADERASQRARAERQEAQRRARRKKAGAAASDDADLSDGRRRVVFTVTSDAPMAWICWRIPANPERKGCAQGRSGPFSMSTTVGSARRYVHVIAEAGPAGSRISCRMTADGRQVSSDTARGAWQWVACSG